MICCKTFFRRIFSTNSFLIFFISVATYAFITRNYANGCPNVLTNDSTGFPKI